ncbi:MAG: hypothetical protein MZV64_17180 [Ignavibacteriales bacterium]|nr:hypothetical protein [Ignavibacteriales bacterium]
MKRLAHDTVDVAVAAVGGEQVEVVAKHGRDVFRALSGERDDLLAVRHVLHASEECPHRLRAV